MSRKKVFLVIIIVLFTSSLFINKNLPSNSKDHQSNQVSTNNSISNVQNDFSLNTVETDENAIKPSRIFVEGNLSYIIRNNHFEIFDINNPANPVLMHSFENQREDSKYLKIFVNNSYAYLLSNLLETDDSYIDIFNCTDITNVNLITSIYDDEEADLFFVLDDLVYLITRREVHIYELQTANEYIFIKSTLSLFNETGGYYIDDYIDFSFSNDTLYLLGLYVFFIIDLADPINPTIITDSGFYQVYGYFSPGKILVRNNTAYISQSFGFFAFNLTNLSNITLQSSMFYSNYSTYDFRIVDEVDFWVTDDYSYLLFRNYVFVVEMVNGNPTNITDILECRIGNVRSSIYPFVFTGLFLSNDLLYLTKNVNSIDREILLIIDATNTSSLTYLWIMEYTDPFKFSDLALWGGISLVILFIIAITFLLIYYVKQNRKQINKNDELKNNTVEKIHETEKSFVVKSTSNKLLSSGFILLAIQNIFALIFIVPIAMGLRLPINYPNYAYTINIPFFLDIIAIIILIVGFGFKIAEKKSKEMLSVIIIWSVWVVSAILYRIFFGMPSYDYLITAYVDSNRYFTTYLNYLIYLPFLLSTMIFSFALIMTASFTDIKKSFLKPLIVMAVLNVVGGVVYYFGIYYHNLYKIAVQHLDDPTGGIFISALGGFFKGIIVPIMAIVLCSLLGYDYIKTIKSKTTSAKK